MRIFLQRLALYVSLTGVIIWIIGGARRGFYVVSEEIHKIEPVTEIAYSDWHPKFLPGMETLLAALILSGSIFLLSFLFTQPSKSENRAS